MDMTVKGWRSVLQNKPAVKILKPLGTETNFLGALAVPIYKQMMGKIDARNSKLTMKKIEDTLMSVSKSKGLFLIRTSELTDGIS